MSSRCAESASGAATDAGPSTLGTAVQRLLLRNVSRLASCGRHLSSSGGRCHRCGVPRTRTSTVAFATLAAAIAIVLLAAARGGGPLAQPSAPDRLSAATVTLETRRHFFNRGSRSRHSAMAATLRRHSWCDGPCPLLHRCVAGGEGTGGAGTNFPQTVNASLASFASRSRRVNESIHRRNYRFLCTPKNPCPALRSPLFPLSAVPNTPQLRPNSSGELPIVGNRTSLLWAVFVVTSAATNVEQRAAIRDTWARAAAKHDMRVVFLVGLSPDPRVLAALGDEWARHGDLVVGDFLDSYDLLTIKSVAMLRWAHVQCGDTARYLVKVDDDMFISVPHLLSVLRAHAGNRRAIIGARRDALRVELRPNRKWRDPLYVKHYGTLHYPFYMSGTTYVIAMSLVRELFAASQVELFDRMEDVFVTGLCARRAGNVTHVRHRGFTTSHRQPCSYTSQLAITGHHVPPSEMRWLWSKLEAGKACASDTHSVES